MATMKQATSAVFELGVIAPIAVAQLTREVAGGVIDATKTTRKAIGATDDLIEVGRTYTQKMLSEAQLELTIAKKAHERVLADEQTIEQYAEAMASQLLRDLNPTEEEIDFKL